jgi:hypothetical protein
VCSILFLLIVAGKNEFQEGKKIGLQNFRCFVRH